MPWHTAGPRPGDPHDGTGQPPEAESTNPPLEPVLWVGLFRPGHRGAGGGPGQSTLVLPVEGHAPVKRRPRGNVLSHRRDRLEYQAHIRVGVGSFPVVRLSPQELSPAHLRPGRPSVVLTRKSRDLSLYSDPASPDALRLGTGVLRRA